MKLLLVTDAVGGVWVYSLELARALKASAIQAVLAVMGPSPDSRQREEAADIAIVDTELPLDWLAAEPGELHSAANVIAKIATREQVDLVQTSSAALLANGDFDQPCVAVQHSCVASWWAAVKGTPVPSDFAWRRGLVREGLNRAAAIVAPSLAFAAETRRIYQPKAQVLAVHNGQRTTRLPAIPQGNFVFAAGRLWDEGKNIATLDRAAARTAVPFQAAGPLRGPNDAHVLLKNIQPLGPLSVTRIAGLLAARPVFASAAVYEPFGLSVLEAAQAGCALVLSEIATHRELWDGAAIFVPPHDDCRFAQTIDDLMRDRDQREQLGELARARARLYSPERMASAMADIYRRVLQPAQPLLAGAAA